MVRLLHEVLQKRYNALRVPRTDRICWTTLALERDKWKDCWRPLRTPEDQRESRPNAQPSKMELTAAVYPLTLAILYIRSEEMKCCRTANARLQ
ncbi:hypothetical protein ANCDUO_13098 [Ancylostoma duodenale]|uniref:Uncharacterized protein n=1 Tax=Ancylostoma duodenale TaxID=51022 RepID=A0A0C2GI22_9BILA|nr:hypothetical protein ANCDUO_13098 [Ancylostoma duodenale]